MPSPIQLSVDRVTQNVSTNHPNPTPSVIWDQVVQAAVRATAPGPTVASRAYGMLHTAMYDAWAAYDREAISTTGSTVQRPIAEKTDANLTEAMSFAAYRVLTDLFPSQKALFDQQMARLSFSTENNSKDETTAAGIGNAAANALLEIRHADGSNQLNNYVDNTGYQPVNAKANEIVQLDKWTPELLGTSPNQRLQKFLTPQWGEVTPFALNDKTIEDFRPVAPKPFLLVEGATVDLASGTIMLAGGQQVNISREIVGTIINPAFIEQAEKVVAYSAGLTDEQKLIAEFWEDAGGTAFPPGTWMTFGQVVSARDANSIDDDALLFFGLANAVFDAGVAAWEAKTYYDYTRPVRAIRALGALGLLNGGKRGVDELTQEEGFVIDAWAGPGKGTKTILAKNFITYQTPNSNPSPPFAEYVSGHSTFSGAGAAVLSLFTHSDVFGASATFNPGDSRFEPTLVPGGPLTLSWDTFTEAANEAGISRLYGGIHFEDGDVNGRILGRNVGEAVWDKIQSFADALAATVSLYQPDVTPISDGFAAAMTAYQTGFRFSEATSADGVTLLLSFDSGTATLQKDFDLSLAGSQNVIAIERIKDGVLVSIAGGVTEASLTIVPATARAGLKTIEARLVDGLDYRLGETDRLVMTLPASSEMEVLDLRGSATDMLTAQVSVYSEAVYDNLIGFYRTNEAGDVLDAQGSVVAAAGSSAYRQAVVEHRLDDYIVGEGTRELTLAGRSLLSTFIISDGSFEQYDPDRLYVSSVNNNSDGTDHIRKLGDHVFAFEDMAGGGDRDFNDMIISVRF